MPLRDLAGTTALVSGAGRGFGRAIAAALVKAGATVVGVARDRGRLDDVRARLGESFVPVVADAADPVAAGLLIDTHRPDTLVLNAGAIPLPRPIHHHTWETFSRNWEVDVRHVFHWVRESLLLPLAPGSVVIAMSSGAAVHGSPISGGYAGAKAAIRQLTAYAADESRRAALGIRFVSLLPPLTPGTDLSAAAMAGYAARQGVDVATFQRRIAPAPTLEQVGDAVVGLASDPGSDHDQDAYLITPAGLAPVT
ncbi:SDR family NAD(P)-dependent oxidoreductase [Streptosporangium sandarakinum]